MLASRAVILLLRGILAAGLMLAAATASAQEDRFTQPDARLIPAGIEPGDAHLARWHGRITLSGQLVLEFERGGVAANDVGFVFFEPDAASLALLPAATGAVPGAPSVLELKQDPRTLFGRLLGGQTTDALFNGRQARYSVPARLTLRGYSSFISCNHRHYGAEVESIELLAAGVDEAWNARDLGC